MKKCLLIALLVVYGSCIFSQENFKIEFLQKYKQTLIQNNVDFSDKQIEKLASNEKLDGDIVALIYASYYSESDIDTENKKLLLAYILDNEHKNNIKFYSLDENIIVEKSAEIFAENWTKYSEGKKLKDNSIAPFVQKELKRLEENDIITSIYF